MMIDLGRGKALVLVGPAGSGKTALAKTIAARNGAYNIIPQGQLQSRFNAALDTATVILDDYSPNWDSVSSITHLLRAPLIIIEKKGEEPQIKTTPNFILCVHSPCPPPPKLFNPRWFQVVVVPPLADRRKMTGAPNSLYVTYEDEAERGGDRTVVALHKEGVLSSVGSYSSGHHFKPVCECCHSHAATHGAYCHVCSLAIELEQKS